MPFDKQDGGGICVAASTLNILQFIDPQLNLSQRELFALFNDGRSGASPGGEMHKHEIINGNEREETLAKFLRHAAEPRIAAELRRKHRIFIPDGGNFIELTGEPDKNGWPCRNTPDGKPDTIKQTAIQQMLEISGGVFYSSKPKDGS